MRSGAPLQGFGADVLAYDIRESEEVRGYGVRYVSKEELLRSCDIISLHCPLLPSTYHIIDAARCWCPVLVCPARHMQQLKHAGQPCTHSSSTCPARGML